MTRNEKMKITERINTFADEVLKNVDRKITPISQQLEVLKPIMEELAAEYQKSVNDIFIIYMDTNAEQGLKERKKNQVEGDEINILYE